MTEEEKKELEEIKEEIKELKKELQETNQILKQATNWILEELQEIQQKQFLFRR